VLQLFGVVEVSRLRGNVLVLLDMVDVGRQSMMLLSCCCGSDLLVLDSEFGIESVGTAESQLVAVSDS
jgi:hypothetical protein